MGSHYIPHTHKAHSPLNAIIGHLILDRCDLHSIFFLTSLELACYYGDIRRLTFLFSMQMRSDLKGNASNWTV